MSIIECRIHKVRFGMEANPEADAVTKEQARWMHCPVCDRIERNKMSEEICRLTDQNKALIAAIEIKREHLLFDTGKKMDVQ